MATSITVSFTRQYEREVHEIFQRQGSFLLQAVRRKSNIKGKSTTFQVIGKGAATTKSRHGTITTMNQVHTSKEVTIADFYAADYVDKLDEAKINHDERLAIARGGAWALGRKADNQVIAELDKTTQAIITWTVTSAATVRNSLIETVEALDNNDVPNDGQRFGLLTPRAHSMAMTVNEFKSSDFVGPSGLPFVTGAPIGAARFRNWMGVNWMVHTDLPGKGTSVAKVFVFHKSAIGYASGVNSSVTDRALAGTDIVTDFWWNGERAAWLINSMMAGQAILIDDTGVIEGNLDDTAPIPTS